MSKMNVLIAGATGYLGNELIKILIKHKKINNVLNKLLNKEKDPKFYVFCTKFIQLRKNPYFKPLNMV